MKYKLSDKLNAFLTDNLSPRRKAIIENHIVETFEESEDLITHTIEFEKQYTVHGFKLSIEIHRSDLVEVEPLKPYVWYDREKWDGNPEDYPLVECTGETYCCTYRLGSKTLYSTTKYFMYIEKVNK